MFNGNGSWSSAFSAKSDRDNGIKILADRFDEILLEDIEQSFELKHAPLTGVTAVLSDHTTGLAANLEADRALPLELAALFPRATHTRAAAEAAAARAAEVKAILPACK